MIRLLRLACCFYRVLLEAKQSLEAECVQLRRRNDALSADLTALRQEMHASSGEKSDELSGVRAELRVKSFELATLGVSFEVRPAVPCVRLAG